MQDEKYSSTLNLFQTELPIRVDFEKSDVEIQEYWKKENIIEKFFTKDIEKENFILHDGPPYANGDIHLGHAYNKILKDIVTRSHRMMGYNVYVRPGWDCHGLPIEHKVSTENSNLNSAEMITACRTYANGWIEKQKLSFKKLGIFMDWDHPYVTMSYKYEADTLRAFADFVKKDYIVRSNKAIPWCCGCKTALASAEIEYKEKKDPSLYVLFKVKESNFFNINNNEVNFLIWTTTPWTLPLNRGVSLKINSNYLLAKSNEKYLIFGKNCLEHLKKTTNFEFEILKEYKTEELLNLTLEHPFEKNKFVKIVQGDHVEDSEGTACVHTAPGCGPVDYEVGIKNNLEIYSPITPDGKYDKGIFPENFEGMSVFDGQIEVIRRLAEVDKIFFKTSIRHSYPHCWRSHEPLIFRATPQWFFKLSNENLKETALNEIEKIQFYPKNGRNFLKATVGSRWEWCLSRQRIWGSPIIALLNKKDDSYILNEDFINKIADKIEKNGIEYWQNVSIEELKKEKIIDESIKIEDYVKENNILDVWFDSGVSHFAVLKEDNNFPADVYLEGNDQHRGWFQSSLLTSVALTGKAPMKKIITHGYTVDEKGQKMSKSIGNVIAPEEITKKYGNDGLRIWASIIGNDGDAVVSETVLKNSGEIYRKIRNTCRFMLQNLSDFNFEENGIKEIKNLHPFDLYALRKMYYLFIKCVNSYQNIEFSQIVHALSEFCSNFLSTLYFDTLKDALYCNQLNDKRRRSAQTAIHYIFNSLTELMAPIFSHTSDLILQNYNKDKNESIHLKRFSKFEFLSELGDFFNLKNKDLNEKNIKDKIEFLKKSEDNDSIEKENELNYIAAWDSIFELRDKLQKSVELLREKLTVKQSIETESKIIFGKNNLLYKNFLEFKKIIESNEIKIETIIEEICSISKINLIENDSNEIVINTKKHLGLKCPRCWRYHNFNENLCERCFKVLK